MKLLRHGPRGQEKPGLLDAAGHIRDLSAYVDDIAGVVLSANGLRKLAGLDPESLPLVPAGTRLGTPVAGFTQLVCIGLNYADHAAEAGAPIPKEPIVFLKANGAINGPYDDVIIPRGSRKTDWEVELCVIIGETARAIPSHEALDYVAGYAVGNDVSEREWQIERGGSWDKGKGADSFGPVGPWLVTRDEVPDPQALRLFCEVDGVMRQDGNTATMIFNVQDIVSYVSHFITLHPGDVIFTGTPPGVGLGIKPEPIYLQPGQMMRLGIQGLGEQRSRVVAAGG